MSKSKHCNQIHLGCGEKKLEGFINIDSRASKYADLVCDMTSLPFSDESLELIYMCHSLEHVEMHKVDQLIADLYRMLKPSGKLYISVPDFNTLSSLYLAQKVNLSTIVRAIHGGQEYPGNTHFMSYDNTLLTLILTNAGFENIYRYEPEELLPHDFNDTSTYEIAGKRISLNLCAAKQ